MLPAGVKSASWEARQEKRKKEESIKLLEKQLKDEREAEEERYVLSLFCLLPSFPVWLWAELVFKEGGHA